MWPDEREKSELEALRRERRAVRITAAVGAWLAGVIVPGVAAASTSGAVSNAWAGLAVFISVMGVVGALVWYNVVWHPL